MYHYHHVKKLKGEFGAVDAAGPWSDEKAFRQFNPAQSGRDGGLKALNARKPHARIDARSGRTS